MLSQSRSAEMSGIKLMTTGLRELPLTDHTDMRLVNTETNQTTADRLAIVQLDPDHPGFRDPEYRARRNAIAEIALTYQSGLKIPDAPYIQAEHQVWSAVWSALQPAHQKYACAEYLSALQRLHFNHDVIPQLSEVSEKVEAISGFRLEP